MGNLSKKRSDYKPLFWLAKDTFLEFLVFEKYTIVKSQITYQKNDSKKISNFNLKDIQKLQLP